MFFFLKEGSIAHPFLQRPGSIYMPSLGCISTTSQMYFVYNAGSIGPVTRTISIKYFVMET